jgi:hypothetical protein
MFFMLAKCPYCNQVYLLDPGLKYFPAICTSCLNLFIVLEEDSDKKVCEGERVGGNDDD